jgi:hypothetical protein
MSKRHLLVSFWVAALCSTILVLFTDIERSVGHWLRCGSPPSPSGLPTRLRAHRHSCR